MFSGVAGTAAADPELEDTALASAPEEDSPLAPVAAIPPVLPNPNEPPATPVDPVMVGLLPPVFIAEYS